MALTEAEELELLELEEQEFLAQQQSASQSQTPDFLRSLTGESDPTADLSSLERAKFLSQAGVEGGSVGERILSAGFTGAEAATQVGKSIAEQKFDIGGGIAGARLGAAVGAPAGPVGVAGGALAGGLAGGVLGKTIDQQVGTQEPQTLTQNLQQTALEELFGFGAGPVAQKLISKIPGVDRLAREISGAQRKTVDDDFITEGLTGDVVSPRGSDIIEAQERLLGGRELTIFEETKGRAGAFLQNELEQAARESNKIASALSKARQNRKSITDAIIQKIGPSNLAVASDDKVLKDLKDTFVAQRKIVSDELNVAEQALIPMRQNAKFDISTLSSDIAAKKEALEQKLGVAGAEGMLKIVDDFLTETSKTGDKFLKKELSLADLEKLKKDVDARIGSFVEGKNAQRQAPAVFATEIMPLFSDAATTAAKADSKLADALLAQKAFDDLATQKAFLDKSKIGEVLGTTKSAQAAKLAGERKLDNTVFRDLETWEQTRELLEGFSPETVEVLEDRFKLNMLNKVRDVIDQDPQFKQLDKFLQDKRGLLESIGGTEFVQNVEDARLIALGLGNTRNMFTAKPTISNGAAIKENLIRYLIHPLAGRIGLAQGLRKEAKKFIGLGEVTDEAIFKAMQGESGQRLVEDMLNRPMADPKSYATYRALTTALGKAGFGVEPLSKEDYEEGVFKLLSSVVIGNDQQLQGETARILNEAKESGLSPEERDRLLLSNF